MTTNHSESLIQPAKLFVRRCCVDAKRKPIRLSHISLITGFTVGGLANLNLRVPERSIIARLLNLPNACHSLTGINS
ncbi:hypothetical protein LOC67_05225 [Stieleria sp. JC731]|uniref:hypothetical protein n=1 Tax=Roseiconus sp. JC912 TaxID=3396307 RepID=UPI003A4C76D2|nr:hypothetical protein [Stieleria sp. JC731]